MIDTWVLNASPLIALGRIQCLGLLVDLAPAILIPDPVLNEIEAGSQKDPETPGILGWARPFRASRVPIPDAVAGWDLGAGEAQVIALCLQGGSRQAVLDDGEARRCALTVGVSMIGTLGILLQAKRKGRLSAVRPLTARLVSSGYYLDHALLEQVLAKAGE